MHENAKSHAMIEDVIEACHNGVVSWERPSDVQPIIIRGQDDYLRTKERWEVLKEYFDKRKIDYYEIMSVNGSIISKIINLIYILDYATVYRAILSEVDPSPIESINFIKKTLSTRF